MAHVRQQVRGAVVTALTGLATTSSRVFASRDARIKPAEMPALCVYTTSESCRTTDKQGGQQRDIELVVEGHAAQAAELDDKLDLIASEVETALFADWSLGGLAVGLVLDRTSIGLLAEDEHGRAIDPKIGLIRLTFTVTVLTIEGSPDMVAN
ncbi:hypothetical protein [Paramagnetospirillum caucaseum]|nr:hypothetical protein [Paramagnetospirillum caucaseum]